MAKKRMDKKSAIAWFIGLLFVGSSAGIGILYTAGGETVKLPKQYILYKDLTEAQKTLAYSKYITLLYFYEQPNCNNCYDIEEKLKQIAVSYEPYVYLIIIRNSNETYIAIDTGHGKQKISSGSFKSIEEKICENDYFLPQCRDIRALEAVNGNGTG